MGCKHLLFFQRSGYFNFFKDLAWDSVAECRDFCTCSRLSLMPYLGQRDGENERDVCSQTETRGCLLQPRSHPTHRKRTSRAERSCWLRQLHNCFSQCEQQNFIRSCMILYSHIVLWSVHGRSENFSKEVKQVQHRYSKLILKPTLQKQSSWQILCKSCASAPQSWQVEMVQRSVCAILQLEPLIPSGFSVIPSASLFHHAENEVDPARGRVAGQMKTS